MSLFFIHGGPGFNSQPEKSMLASEFSKIDSKCYFWNEPSIKRNATNPIMFNDTLNHFEAFFNKHKTESNIIIAHSFGAFTALSLSSELLQNVKQVFLISPTLNLRALDENIVSIATTELKRLGNEEKVNELLAQKEKFTDTYDLHRFNTTLNALVSVDLLSFYWFNQSQMAKYQSYFQGEYEFDIGNFQSIRMSIQNEILKNKIKIPTTMIFGEHDQISKLDDMECIQANFNSLKIIEMKEVAHYPHIEESKQFFKQIKKELIS